MGRAIDLNVPLTDEDRAYLKARSREGEIKVNDRQFGHLSDAEKDKLRGRGAEDAADDAKAESDYQKHLEEQELPWDDDLVDKVAPLKVAELRAHLKKYGQPDDGKRDELEVRLLDFLQARRDEAQADSSEEDDLDEEENESSDS